MVGLFLCWIAGSYWRKIYYTYITLQELLMILGFALASSMGEEGDYDPVTGSERGIIVLMLVFLIVMLILYAKDTRIADAFNIIFLVIVFWEIIISLSIIDCQEDKVKNSCRIIPNNS